MVVEEILAYLDLIVMAILSVLAGAINWFINYTRRSVNEKEAHKIRRNSAAIYTAILMFMFQLPIYLTTPDFFTQETLVIVLIEFFTVSGLGVVALSWYNKYKPAEMPSYTIEDINVTNVNSMIGQLNDLKNLLVKKEGSDQQIQRALQMIKTIGSVLKAGDTKQPRQEELQKLSDVKPLE
jgi:hypothetical protein